MNEAPPTRRDVNLLVELACDIAGDDCEAYGAGWRCCADREASELMARGYMCRSCRAHEALGHPRRGRAFAFGGSPSAPPSGHAA